MPAKFRRWILVGMFALLLGSLHDMAAAGAPVASPRLLAPVGPELLTQVQQSGAVRVIVGLKVPFQPEGDLPNAADAAQQQQGITRAQQALLGKPALRNARNVKTFEYIPFLATEVDAATLAALAADPDVTSITEDRLAKPTLAESVPLIGGPQAYAAGYTGAGQTVAVLDTGVDKNHLFLAGKVVSEACYSSTTSDSTSLCPGGVPESTVPGSGLHCTGTSGCDHGTHVAGIAAGKGASFSGVAKDAQLIAVQVFSRFSAAACGGLPCLSAWDSDIVKGLERVYALRGSHAIASVNMSLGGGQYSTPFKCDADNAATKAAIDNLRSAGIATVIASGNESHRDRMSSPGCISTAVSVGSTTEADVISDFSNNATFLHLLAPGSSITSSVPGGGFATFNGTSMATPHVAGAWAILKQRVPTAGVSQVLAALQSSGQPIADTRPATSGPVRSAGLPDNIKRRIRVDTALAYLVSACYNYEPNGNAASAAREFALGATELHTFCPGGDLDWVKFTVPASAQALSGGAAYYVMATFGLTPGNDTALALYGPPNYSTPIAYNDDISGGNPASAIVRNLNPGVYYLVAFGKAGSENKAYNLWITRYAYSDAACNINEPNETFGDAKPITLGAITNAAFCESPDFDFVYFDAQASTQYRIEAINPGPKTDAVIEVYNASFNYLGTIDVGFEGDPESGILTSGSGGRFYLLYYDYYGNYGPALAYGARVTHLPGAAVSADGGPTLTLPEGAQNK